MDVEGYGVFVTDGGSDKLFRCPLVERLAHFGWYGNVPGTADTAAAFGGYGESDGELIGPGDVALGPDGLLFVAESRFGRSRFGVCPPMVCALSSP